MADTPGSMAWETGASGLQGSSKQSLPPKPRTYGNSPVSSVDRDATASIGRSGIKGARLLTPGNWSVHSGGKFSFGKCRLPRRSSSPNAAPKPASSAQHQAGTPSLFLGGAKKCQPQHGASPRGTDSMADALDDTMQSRDGCAEAQPFLDLDLLHHSSSEAIDATIAGLSGAQLTW